MAKQFYDSIIINGPVNASGLQLAKLLSGAPPVIGSAIGVDSSGNVVLLNAVGRQAILADISVTNSAADTAVIAVTCPANTLTAAAVFEVQANGKMVVALTGGVMNFWIKVGTTKVVTLSYTFTLSLNTNYYWQFNGLMTQRTSGTSGTMKTFGNLEISNGTSSMILSLDSVPTVDTTAAQTITFGFNWSAAGAGNTLTASQAVIAPV